MYGLLRCRSNAFIVFVRSSSSVVDCQRRRPFSSMNKYRALVPRLRKGKQFAPLDSITGVVCNRGRGSFVSSPQVFKLQGASEFQRTRVRIHCDTGTDMPKAQTHQRHSQPFKTGDGEDGREEEDA